MAFLSCLVIVGTPLPPGLHIKHNLQTGVTEAKLMDEDEAEESKQGGQSNSLTMHPEKSGEHEESNLSREEEPTDQAKIPIDDLKAMLKRMKSDEAGSEGQVSFAKKLGK